MEHLIKSELERRLKKKRAEVAAWEEKIEDLQGEIDDCKGHISIAQISIDELQSLYNLIPSADVNGSLPAFRQNSDGWLVHRLLLKAGAPLYIDEILIQLEREINSDSKASLAGQLGGYVRKGQVFTRPAPNTFGLREWEAGNKSEKEKFLSDGPYEIEVPVGDIESANSNELESAA